MYRDLKITSMMGYHNCDNPDCFQCNIQDKSEDTIKFINKARSIHGNKYNYSKTNYTGCNNKVIITCPIHGDFEIIANTHTRKKYPAGCKKCFKENRTKTTKQFIEDAKLVHGDKYNYDKVDYINTHTKIIITCPIHGDFKQDPASHLSGCNCPACSGHIKPTTNEMISRFISVHGNRYNYDKVVYEDPYKDVIITCPIHGDFKQNAYNHLKGCNCPKCASEDKLNSMKLEKTENFLKEATKIHGDKYNYKKVDYINTHTKIIITCPIHGDFKQIPNSHLNGSGCPKCFESHGEKDIRVLMEKNNIPYESQKRFPDSVIGHRSYDFYVNNSFFRISRRSTL